LVDVSQEVITIEDCGGGHWIEAASKEQTGETLPNERDAAAASIAHPKSGEAIVCSEMITEENFHQIESAKVDAPCAQLECEAAGLCAKCCGRDLARGGLIRPQKPSASSQQSIGELAAATARSTQAVSPCKDITRVYRVEELFEGRDPKVKQSSEIDGTVRITEEDGLRQLKISASHVKRDEYDIPSAGARARWRQGERHCAFQDKRRHGGVAERRRGHPRTIE
jgi:hypothetical protein